MIEHFCKNSIVIIDIWDSSKNSFRIWQHIYRCKIIICYGRRDRDIHHPVISICVRSIVLAMPGSLLFTTQWKMFQAWINIITNLQRNHNSLLILFFVPFHFLCGLGLQINISDWLNFPSFISQKNDPSEDWGVFTKIFGWEVIVGGFIGLKVAPHLKVDSAMNFQEQWTDSIKS